MSPADCKAWRLGATYCTSEINTSEINADVQRHFPLDFQWRFPTEFHFPGVLSKGLSLVQWIFYWKVPLDDRWHFPTTCDSCDLRCVIFCPECRWSRSSPLRPGRGPARFAALRSAAKNLSPPPDSCRQAVLRIPVICQGFTSPGETPKSGAGITCWIPNFAPPPWRRRRSLCDPGPFPRAKRRSAYIYIYIHTYMYIYVYIYRERERNTHVCV